MPSSSEKTDHCVSLGVLAQEEQNRTETHD